MIKQYKITYVYEDEPNRKHVMFKFGTNADDIEKTFNEYCHDRGWKPARIIEMEITDDDN